MFYSTDLSTSDYICRENEPSESPEKSSYKIIPNFHYKLPKNNDTLAQKLREEARTLFLQKRSKELLNNNELKTLWNILQMNYTQPCINNDQYINYIDYLKVIELAEEKCRPYLTSTTFLRLQGVCEYSGYVNIMALFNYTMRKVWLQQTRIGLSLYDFSGQGYLRESVR